MYLLWPTSPECNPDHQDVLRMWDSPPKKNLHIICHCYKVWGEATPMPVYVYKSSSQCFTWGFVLDFDRIKGAVFQVTSVVTPSAAGISWPHLVDGDRLSSLKSWSKNPLANCQIFRNEGGDVLVKDGLTRFLPFLKQGWICLGVKDVGSCMPGRKKRRNLFVEHLEDHPS